MPRRANSVSLKSLCQQIKQSQGFAEGRPCSHWMSWKALKYIGHDIAGCIDIQTGAGRDEEEARAWNEREDGSASAEERVFHWGDRRVSVDLDADSTSFISSGIYRYKTYTVLLLRFSRLLCTNFGIILSRFDYVIGYLCFAVPLSGLTQ